MVNVKVLKETIKKWVHEYNILDKCLELQQWKIKELKADIKELGSIIECKTGTIVTLAKTRDNLKAENERLKEEIENNKSAYQVELGTYNMECGNLLEENKILQDSFNGQKNAYKQLNKQYKELKTCLQKIKEIAEFHITDADSEDVQNDMKQILDLITKAESEEE